MFHLLKTGLSGPYRSNVYTCLGQRDLSGTVYGWRGHLCVVEGPSCLHPCEFGRRSRSLPQCLHVMTSYSSLRDDLFRPPPTTSITLIVHILSYRPVLVPSCPPSSQWFLRGGEEPVKSFTELFYETSTWPTIHSVISLFVRFDKSSFRTGRVHLGRKG